MPGHPREIPAAVPHGPGCNAGHGLPSAPEQEPSAPEQGPSVPEQKRAKPCWISKLFTLPSDHEILMQRQVISAPPALLMRSMSDRGKEQKKEEISLIE